ncbi:MAG: hypothetical protein JO351_06395 [Candidatus Eremiobacteraeota bacterium]|nr:hypothetical protein [Candidatus Eremiobacteraeota bacterium]
MPALTQQLWLSVTTVTPFGVWLALVAVSSISYSSYLLQRYVFQAAPRVPMSILGGIYSSTLVLSRRARDEGMTAELAGYCVAFVWRRENWIPASALAMVARVGAVLAFVVVR